MDKKKENRQKILIVDDSEMNRAILEDMLAGEFDILEAVNGVEAVAILHRMSTQIALVMLDIVMPEMDGFEVLAVMNKHHWIEDVPVIMISAENTPRYVERAYELGVTDYINRPFDFFIVHRRVINTIMLYAKQKRLIGMVTDQIYEREKSSSLMVNILSHIVEFRNGESGLHVLHIQTMTEILLRQLLQKTDKYQISNTDISLISMASALHDIGKIAIPDQILNKPGKLTKEEFEVMKTHSLVGAQMLSEMPFHKNEPLVKAAYEICRWHHERYDGGGYPDGLKGDEIPISAQIVSIADVYDALTSERVYKPPFSHNDAMKMILNGECGVFDPFLLECLQECSEHIRMELHVSSLSSNNRKEMRKIAEELQQHEELSASERTLRLLEHERTKYQFFASMSQEVQFEYTVMPCMVTLSEWGAKRLGLQEVIMEPQKNKRVLAIFGEEHLEELKRKIMATTSEDPVTQYDFELTLRGEKRWSRIICRAMWNSEEPPQYTGVIGKMTDIHELHTHMTELEFKASYDPLTGLLNHQNARIRIQEMIEENPQGNFAMVIFDLDYFKKANDNYGHIFGDKVLKQVANKLHKSIRGDDIAARIGGDEFLLFMEYGNNAIDSIMRRIYNALGGKVDDFEISISMGVARSELVGTDYDTMLHCADQALYAVKRSGRGRFAFYEDSMKDTLLASTTITPIDSDER